MDRSKIILFSIGGVTLLAFAVFGFLGLKTGGAAKEALEARDAAIRKIEKIYSKADPFPSRENVAKVREYADRMEQVRSGLTNTLAGRNVPAPKLTSSVFMQSLSRLAKTKRENAPIVDGKKIVAPDFTFGFGRYFGANSTMPKDENGEVPRLLQQLFVVDALVDALYAAKVSRIESIGREVFEQEAQVAEPQAGVSRRGGRRAPKKKAKQSGKAVEERASQHFSVTFDAHQDAAIDFVNRLSKTKYFVLITDISFQKRNSDIRVPGLADDSSSLSSQDEGGFGGRRSSRRRRAEQQEAIDAGAASALPAISKLPPGQRLMSGAEIDPLISVTVEFDVYGFAKGGK